MTHWTDDLVARRACDEGVTWARTQPDLATAWRTCSRGSWMMWWLGKYAAAPHERAAEEAAAPHERAAEEAAAPHWQAAEEAAAPHRQAAAEAIRALYPTPPASTL